MRGRHATMGIFCTNADDAPALPGAYVLAVELSTPVTLALPGKPAACLNPGRYLYCGSARPPPMARGDDIGNCSAVDKDGLR